MGTISLCMIVRDEEAVLARCLESAAPIADEIVVVDTGSADATRTIAARYGRVVDFPWRDDFAAARNFAFDQGRCDYLMWLDADDVIPPDQLPAFLALKEELDGSVDVVMLPYRTAFAPDGAPTFVYARERLIRRGAGLRWQGAVHECIAPQGRVRWGTAAVEHRKEGPGGGDRNLRIYEALLARGEALDARGAYYYARELLFHGRHAQAEGAFRDFLAREDGWVEDRIQASRDLAACLAAQGRRGEAEEALVRSFAWDLPRGETCCQLAGLEAQAGRWERAAFWYETALRTSPREESGAFVHLPSYGYLPCLGLCQCCDRLGRREEAEAWNQRAAEHWPESPAVAWNRRYFASLEGSGAEAPVPEAGEGA